MSLKVRLLMIIVKSNQSSQYLLEHKNDAINEINEDCGEMEVLVELRLPQLRNCQVEEIGMLPAY